MSVRRSVSFYSEGSRIAADLFLPADFEPDQKHPGIVLCSGFTGVRQLVLPEYAQAFAEVCLSDFRLPRIRRQRREQVAATAPRTG
jgi:hypothetical protein